MNTKRSLLGLLVWISASLTILAQGPNNTGTYYQSANGKSGQALKTAFYGIIKSPKVTSYDGLIDAYQKTDKRSDGKLRDWYSNATNYTWNDRNGNSSEGAGWNREHSVPQSWFSKASPMKSDIVHVVPTDCYVNNRRGSYPFGEVGKVSWQSKNNYSKLGISSRSGYSGTVFEPNDEVKGDIARIYFYMVTCYEDKISNWKGGSASNVFDGSQYPGLTSWTLTMMMEWSKNDPVDDIERARNEAVQDVQGNRNPFVDYPGLEDYVWGDKKNEAFDYTNFSGTTTTVHTPYFTPTGGTYTEAQSVSISCTTSGAAIYYTTDGTTPSESSTRYTSALTISETTTVRAIAIKGSDKSSIATATYTITTNSGTTPSGDYVWSEDWTGAEAGASAESVKNDAATYVGDGGTFCKIFEADIAGGTSPELLIPNTNRDKNSFEATIALGGVSGELPLTFKCNRDLSVTSTTSGVVVTKGTVADKTYNYTITVPSGTSTLVLSFATTTKDNARIDDIVLAKPTGTTEKTDPQLSFDKTSFTVTEEDDFTPPTLSNPYDVAVEYSSNNEDVALVDETTGYVVIGMAGTAVITATFPGNDTYTASAASYTIEVTAKSHGGTTTGTGVYQRISSSTELESGKNYLIVYEGDPAVALTKFDGTKETGSVSINDNKIDLSDTENSALSVYLEKEGNLWTVKGNNLYMALTSDNNTLNSATTASDVSAKWTIEFSGDVPTITNANLTTRSLKYNASSGQFRCYKQGQQDVALYKEIVEEVATSVSVSIGETGYGTLYYSDKNLIVPADVVARTYNIVNGTLMETYAYYEGDIIPQDVAVVLSGAEDEYSFEITDEEGFAIEDNMLRGFDEAGQTTVGDNSSEDYLFYKLTTKNGKNVGFYWGAEHGAAFTMTNAHKAYLAVPVTAAAKIESFIINGDVNGVRGIETSGADHDGIIYDLYGRKTTMSALPKGVYIIKGNKVKIIKR